MNKGNRQIEEGKTALAMQTVVDGCNYYTNKIIKAINPYPVADAALVVLALRTYASAIENENPESIPLLKTLEKILDVPVFNTETQKERTRRRK